MGQCRLYDAARRQCCPRDNADPTVDGIPANMTQVGQHIFLLYVDACIRLFISHQRNCQTNLYQKRSLIILVTQWTSITKKWCGSTNWGVEKHRCGCLCLARSTPSSALEQAPLVPLVIRHSLRHNLSRQIQQCNQYKSVQHEINYESAMERLVKRNIIKQRSKNRKWGQLVAIVPAGDETITRTLSKNSYSRFDGDRW